MENESGNTSEEEINLFDPKIFIESLFKTREAEIELILNTTTTTTTSTTANFTKILNSDTTNNNDKDIDQKDHLDYTLDVYLLIGAVSFVIFVILSVAMCKAITMLKISLQDGADDTVPVPAEQLQNQEQQQATRPELVTQSVASGYLLNGIRQFSATLRSRISLKSEDDLPPPYDAEAFGITTNQDNENEEASPPPYHVAITMTSENATQPQVLTDEEGEEEVEDEDDDDDDEQEISADETDSKVNFAAKKVRTPKLPKISS